MSERPEVAARAVSVVAALAVAFAAFGALGYDVPSVITGIVEGAITGPGAVTQTLRWTIPLLVLSLGIIASLRAGEFNIGGQGQLLAGALASVAVALEWSGPAVLVIVAALLAGIVAGATWAAIAAALKVLGGADEVIVTLMLNFIAVLLVQWVTTGPLKDQSTRGQAASTPRLDDAVRLTDGDGVSVVFLLAVVVIVGAAWLMLERSRLGLHLTFVGGGPVAAAWQGIDVRRVRFASYVLAGSFAGLAGALEVLGPSGRVVTGATPGLGFTAVVVTIVGSVRVVGVIGSALVFGGLQAAVLYLPIVSDLPAAGFRLIEGLIALLITAKLAVLLRRRRTGAVAALPAESEPELAAAASDGVLVHQPMTGR